MEHGDRAAGEPGDRAPPAPDDRREPRPGRGGDSADEPADGRPRLLVRLENGEKGQIVPQGTLEEGRIDDLPPFRPSGLHTTPKSLQDLVQASGAEAGPIVQTIFVRRMRTSIRAR